MFRNTVARLYNVVSRTKLSDLPESWRSPVDTVLKSVEGENSRFKNAEIKGAPHKSTTDPDDPKDVVSVRLKDENNKRIDTIHIHEDGTSQYRSKGK